MSTLDSKLEYRAPSVQSPARRKLSSLVNARGYVALGRSPRGEVDWCRIDFMERHAFWRRIQPGVEGLFELEEVRDAD